MGIGESIKRAHDEYRRFFAKLFKTSLQDANTTVRVGVHKLMLLYDIMHTHWLKEEETMIPFGPDYFSEDEWEDFGKRFDEIVEEYLKKH